MSTKNSGVIMVRAITWNKHKKACLELPLKKRQNKGLKTDGILVQVKSNLQNALFEHSEILLTCIKQ